MGERYRISCTARLSLSIYESRDRDTLVGGGQFPGARTRACATPGPGHIGRARAETRPCANRFYVNWSRPKITHHWPVDDVHAIQFHNLRGCRLRRGLPAVRYQIVGTASGSARSAGASGDAFGSMGGQVWTRGRRAGFHQVAFCRGTRAERVWSGEPERQRELARGAGLFSFVAPSITRERARAKP